MQLCLSLYIRAEARSCVLPFVWGVLCKCFILEVGRAGAAAAQQLEMTERITPPRPPCIIDRKDCCGCFSRAFQSLVERHRCAAAGSLLLQAAWCRWQHGCSIVGGADF